MPSFEISPATTLWDATPVSNSFLCEYMPIAPENHVKVYLYALMIAHSGLYNGGGLIADAQRVLELSEAEIRSALNYWIRCRLMERISDDPPQYRFVNPAKILFDQNQLPVDEAYERFSQSLTRLFEGKKRTIHGAETSLAFEWVEDLKIPAEIVIMLIQFMMATRGQYFKFKDAEKIAIDLKTKKITSVEEAEAFFAGQEKQHKGAKKVLKKLAILRDPTEPELELYHKWTAEWGFQPEAILQACAGTTAATMPTFAYLDKILENLHRQSSTDLASAAKTMAEEKREVELIREVLSELGISQDVIGDGEKMLYRGLAPYGHDMIMIAAAQVKARFKVHTLDHIGELLRKWSEKGINKPELARNYIQKVDTLNHRLHQLNDRFRSKPVYTSEASREFVRRWGMDWNMPDSLINLAADYSSNANDPLLYMDAMLTRWHEKSISDIASAQKEHEEHMNAQARNKEQPAKKVNAQMYNQRNKDLSAYDVLTPEEIEEIKQYEK